MVSSISDIEVAIFIQCDAIRIMQIFVEKNKDSSIREQLLDVLIFRVSKVDIAISVNCETCRKV
jgi:hypothetical protein